MLDCPMEKMENAHLCTIEIQ